MNSPGILTDFTASTRTRRSRYIATRTRHTELPRSTSILEKRFTGKNTDVQTNACRTQPTVNPTPKRVNCRGMKKTKARIGASLGRIRGAQARALAYYIKIDQHTLSPHGNIGGLQAPRCSPSLPSPILNLSTFSIST